VVVERTLRATAKWEGDIHAAPIALMLGQGRLVITIVPSDAKLLARFAIFAQTGSPKRGRPNGVRPGQTPKMRDLVMQMCKRWRLV